MANFGQTLHSRTTPYTPSYSVSLVSYSEKNDCDISRAHCTVPICWFSPPDAALSGWQIWPWERRTLWVLHSGTSGQEWCRLLRQTPSKTDKQDWCYSSRGIPAVSVFVYWCQLWDLRVVMMPTFCHHALAAITTTSSMASPMPLICNGKFGTDTYVTTLRIGGKWIIWID